MRAIESQIKDLLVEELDVAANAVSEMTLQTPLLGRGIGLDSMESLTLITAIEQTFEVEVGDEELDARLFRSLGALVDFVSAKTVAASARRRVP